MRILLLTLAITGLFALPLPAAEETVSGTPCYFMMWWDNLEGRWKELIDFTAEQKAEGVLICGLQGFKDGGKRCREVVEYAHARGVKVIHFDGLNGYELGKHLLSERPDLAATIPPEIADTREGRRSKTDIFCPSKPDSFRLLKKYLLSIADTGVDGLLFETGDVDYITCHCQECERRFSSADETARGNKPVKWALAHLKFAADVLSEAHPDIRLSCEFAMQRFDKRPYVNCDRILELNRKIDPRYTVVWFEYAAPPDEIAKRLRSERENVGFGVRSGAIAGWEAKRLLSPKKFLPIARRLCELDPVCIFYRGWRPRNQFAVNMGAAAAILNNPRMSELELQRIVADLEKKTEPGGPYWLAAEAVNLIPTPQQCEWKTGEVQIVKGGKAVATIFLSDAAGKKENLAAKYIADEIEKLTGAAVKVRPRQEATTSAGVKIMLGVHGGDAPSGRSFLPCMDEQDRGVLGGAMAEQAYVLDVAGDAVVILGGSEQGALYGATTLLQLLDARGENLYVPAVHVRDWPDFRYRVADNWTFAEGIDGEGLGWHYDWGDGLEHYQKRVEAVLDRCLRYKINAISVDGWFYDTLPNMWDWKKISFVRALNQYARQRGIKLVFGRGWIGKYPLNRTAYPDGEVYECGGSEGGTCRSNEAQHKIKQAFITEFVRNLEPGALYIHSEDASTYHSASKTWKRRCDACKKRWPNDVLEATDGGAAGYANAYNKVCEAIFTVKNEDSGYDAARDCLVLLISPCYTYYYESDEDWDKAMRLWANVGRLLEFKKNVNVGIREQFLRRDNNKPRVTELAETLAAAGEGGPGLYVYCLSKSNIYYPRKSLIFSPAAPLMSKINEGAETLYYTSGGIFQEPQTLLNAEYMWNSESTGYWLPPEKAMEYGKVPYWSYYGQPPAIYGPGGFLDRACTLLYGKEAGQHMKKIYQRGELPIYHGRRLLDRGRERKDHDWARHIEATRNAIRCAESALKSPDCRAECRELLERFLKCLKAGEMFVRLRMEFMELAELKKKEPAEEQKLLRERFAQLEEGIDAMERYLRDNFGSDWATPKGGDSRYWKPMLDDMRKSLPPATVKADAPQRRCSDPPVIRSSWDDLLEGVKSLADWRNRREALKRRFLDLIRDDQKPPKPPLELKVHESVVVDGAYTRKLISYNVEADERAHAYLGIPLRLQGKVPGIVALHQTYVQGKEEVAGLKGNPANAHLDHLCRRGYVVIAPDHFVAGDRIPPEGAYDTTRFYKKHPEWTAVGKFTYEHSIAVDLLRTLDEVDPERIGALGHSLGGQGTIFLAAYDSRIIAAACNCGGGHGASCFRYNPRVQDLARDHWYVYFKHIRPGLLEGQLPAIDFHEIISLIAPRAFLDVSSLDDGNPLTQRQRVLMLMKVMDVYELEKAPRNFAFYVHGCGHKVTHASRELMYGWLDMQLKKG